INHMNENITRILKMLEESKIDSEKAAELINALKEKENSESVSSQNKEKMLKVNVLTAQGKNVNINLPLKFVKSSLKAFGKIPLNINLNGDLDRNINIQDITNAIESEIEGKILDVKTDSGETIEVIIE
ncbi:MAG: hypothetical protein ACHQJ4_06905, partial [Ignavibacteria bacterium]